jgi:hypothetical protein
MFISAVVTFILYMLVFLKLRGTVRAQRGSNSSISTEQERNEIYEHRLARQMLLYPACVVSYIPSPHSNVFFFSVDRLHDYDHPYYLLPLLCMGRPSRPFLTNYR